jgi:sialate O-acetylesterase
MTTHLWIRHKASKFDMRDPKLLYSETSQTNRRALPRRATLQTMLLASLMSCLIPTAVADVRLPHLLSDNMVLQRDLPIPVWGWANPNEKVTVRLGKSSASATAGADGQWSVKLPKLPAGGPYQMTVAGANTLTLSNILIGEVWVCAGQSNMEKPIGIHPGQQPCLNYEKEIAAADYPQIRLMEVPPASSQVPVDDIASAEWLVCTPQNIVVKRGGGHGYSACAYFFGRELHKELKVPIGLIAASVSGCPCEPFTPPAGDRWLGMIHPLTPFGIRGAIWYQGESNLANGMRYHDKMKTLIPDWRKAWAQGDFPFLYVQVALSKYNDDVEMAPRLWEAQTATLDVPNTGMVVTHDISSYPDCHALNKQEVGRRLALWALAKTYGKSSLVYSGPIYKSMDIAPGSGPTRIRIQFDSTGAGLASRERASRWIISPSPGRTRNSSRPRPKSTASRCLSGVTLWSSLWPCDSAGDRMQTRIS